MNKAFLWIGCLTLFLLAGCTNAGKKVAKKETTFTNPVIYSDVPDVDVIRVGSDYYMISTTAHMSPGAPIMHSGKAATSIAVDSGQLLCVITTVSSMYSSARATSLISILQKTRQERGNRSWCSTNTCTMPLCYSMTTGKSTWLMAHATSASLSLKTIYPASIPTAYR